MGRIRTIKPEFPQSESVGRLSRDARLCFILLWTFVDDSGKARAASRMLASHLFPYDDDAPSLIDSWLAELDRENLIRRYEVDGSRYLEICNWLKHQRIDRPSASRLPDFDEGSRVFDEGSTTDLGPRTKDQGPGTKERGGAPASPSPAARSPRLGSRIPADWNPGDGGYAFARGLNLDPDRVLESFLDYWTAATGSRAVKASWDATWRTWCRKEAERNGAQSGGGGRGTRSAPKGVVGAVLEVAASLRAREAAARPVAGDLEEVDL